MTRYKSQSVAYPYFVLAVLLFALQIVAGLIAAAQYIWPDLMASTLPFNVGRTIHVNLLVFWLLLGIMGGTYFLLPEETGAEVYSGGLAWLQVLILAATGVAAVVGYLFGWTEGREYIEAPRLLDWFIVAGALVFLFNVVMTVIKAGKLTVTLGVLLTGLVGLSLIYLFGMKFFGNVVLDQFFWWWVIHLWVEGTWELVAMAITAFLLIKLTGVDRKLVEKWLYIEVALVLGTGILGTGHHYYWIGTPRYWLAIGGVFSFLEVVPIVLMVVDAYRHLRAARSERPNRLALDWTIGGAAMTFFGAGVFGAVQTLPQINYWTHGTQITPSHGHPAFFGAFGMIVIAVIYYAMPILGNRGGYDQRRGRAALHTMVWSMVAMAFVLFGAGIVQVYFERVAGVDFALVKDTYLRFWMVLRWATGIVFAAGTALFLVDFFGLFMGRAVAEPGPARAAAPAAARAATRGSG